MNPFSSIGLLREDEINTSGPVALNRELERGVVIRGPQIAAGPHYSTAPVVAGLTLRLELCRHRPAFGRTPHWEHGPTRKLLTVTPSRRPLPALLGSLTLQCLVLKEKWFTSLLWYKPPNYFQEKAHHGQLWSLNTI